MTARELADLLLKVPEAEVRIWETDVWGYGNVVPMKPTDVVFNPEANAWIISPE